MNRIWHPYNKWEEIGFGMWSVPVEPVEQLRHAIIFTGNHRLYGRYMMRVVREWKYSCENAFTNSGLNHKAWVGHAAAALAIRVPECVTRKAWGYLNDEQQRMANRSAQIAIDHWHTNRAGREVHTDLAGTVLPGRYTG